MAVDLTNISNERNDSKPVMIGVIGGLNRIYFSSENKTIDGVAEVVILKQDDIEANAEGYQVQGTIEELPEGWVDLGIPINSPLLDEIAQTKKDVFVERSKLSNYYHKLIGKNAPVEEFAANYRKIEELSQDFQQLQAKEEHVMKTGDLPGDKNTGSEDDINALKVELRKLANIKNKEKAKLNNKIKNPEGSTKAITIHERIALIELQQNEVRKKIKALQ